MSQLFEKKIKIREDKERPINFSYFLARVNRLNKLFIRPVLLSQSFGKKINSQKVKSHFSWNFLFFCQA
ncbi:hypothetical protein IV76_GL001339 [Carnobacterium maltaromaticum]|nr:hypothetical protein IV76_GL001339 [Carnobacterium maltaromaticum]